MNVLKVMDEMSMIGPLHGIMDQLPKIFSIRHHLKQAVKRYTPSFNLEHFAQFNEEYATEDTCYALLHAVKWPEGFRCPQCNHHNAYTIKRKRLPLYQCVSCRHQTSLTAGTIMEKSRTPLRKWLIAIFFASQNDFSVNAMQLSQIINVTYKTAWSMFHRIRYVTSIADEYQSLTGTVIGSIGICSALTKPFLDFSPQEKPVITAASVNENNEPTYMKIKIIPTTFTTPRWLQSHANASFEAHHLAKQTKNITWYKRFQFDKKALSIRHHFKNINARLVHTYRGISKKHLQAYLDEACYRINIPAQGRSAFHELAKLCTTTTKHSISMMY